MRTLQESVQPPPQWLEHPAFVEAGKAESCWVPAVELLSSRFLSRHTRFSSLESLLSAGRLTHSQFSDLGEQPNRSWDAFIQRSSRFADWNAMLRDARGEWLMLRMGLIVDPSRDSEEIRSGTVAVKRSQHPDDAGTD